MALYIADLAVTHKPATVGRHMAAIAAAHKAQNYESPCSMRNGAVSAVWHGIKRTMGTVQIQKSPLLVPDLRKIAENLTIPCLAPATARYCWWDSPARSAGLKSWH